MKTKTAVAYSIVTLFLLTSLVYSLDLVQKVRKLLTKASGQPANIVVDATVDYGPVNQIWRAFAQGGEEKFPFTKIIPEIKTLNPVYIRIDHLYDMYGVVSRDGDGLKYDWTELDQAVGNIIEVGAKPFLSLSYMPPAISSGSITDPPKNWQDWQSVVQMTIEHYSGKSQKNLSGVIYEVWNEPDLFGGWRVGSDKDYRVLYLYASRGAQSARNTNSFKIGGPATTAPYENWVGKFLNYVSKNKLRFDFYSWHRYTIKPVNFLTDLDKVDSWLFQNAAYSLPKYLTEWGSDSENSNLHDSQFDAAHLVATVRQMLQRADLIFTFEIKDGPSPEGKKYWGRWGLLTHEIGGPIEKKPKYRAFSLLNKINGNLLRLSGEGTWVTGFAVKDNGKIKIILTNLDKNGQNFENVPISILGLEEGNYEIKNTSLLAPAIKKQEASIQGIVKFSVPLPANDVALIELNKR